MSKYSCVVKLLNKYSISVEDKCISPKKDHWPEAYKIFFDDLQNLTANTPVLEDRGSNNTKDRAKAFFASYQEEWFAADEASPGTRIHSVMQSKLSRILINALQENGSERSLLPKASTLVLSSSFGPLQLHDYYEKFQSSNQRGHTV